MRHAIIIYGEHSGIVRRVVKTDDPGSLLKHVEPGELFVAAHDRLFDTKDGYPVHDKIVEHVEHHRGRKAESGRCLLIHHGTGEVVDVIMADPHIDKIDGHTLHQDETGVRGAVPNEMGEFHRVEVE